MTTIIEAISDLLFVRDTVVVPGLGAFIKKPVSAKVNPVANYFSMPSSEITFDHDHLADVLDDHHQDQDLHLLLAEHVVGFQYRQYHGGAGPGQDGPEGYGLNGVVSHGRTGDHAREQHDGDLDDGYGDRELALGLHLRQVYLQTYCEHQHDQSQVGEHGHDVLCAFGQVHVVGYEYARYQESHQGREPELAQDDGHERRQNDERRHY